MSCAIQHTACQVNITGANCTSSHCALIPKHRLHLLDTACMLCIYEYRLFTLAVSQALAKPKTDRSCIFSHSLKPPTLQRRYRQSHRLAAQDSQADTDPPRNPLFANNPQFAAAFSHVVTRQGDEAVYSGAQAAKPAE